MELDSLELIIQSSVNKVDKSLDTLIEKLGVVSDRLSAIKTGKGMEQVAQQSKAVSESIGKLGESVSASMKPAQEQAKKVSKTLEQITAQYKDLGKGFELKGDTGYIQKQIDTLANKLENAKLKKDELEASGKTKGQAYENAIKDVIKYTNQIESLQKQLVEMQSAQPQIDIKINKLDEIKENAEQIKQVITDIPTQALNFDTSAMQSVFGQSAKELENYQEALEQFGQQAGKVLNEGITNIKIFGEETNRTLGDFARQLSEYDKIIEAGGQETETGLKLPVRGLEMSLEQLRLMYPDAKELIDSYEAEIERAKSLTLDIPTLQYENIDLSGFEQQATSISEKFKEFGKNLEQLVIPPIKEDNLDKLNSALNKTEQKLEELRAKLENGLVMGKIKESVDDSTFRNLQEQIALTEKQSEALRSKIAQIGNISIFEKLKQSISNIPTAVKKLNGVFSTLSGTLNKINNGVNKLFSRFTSLAKSIFKTTSENNKANTSFKGGLMTILKYGLGIRSLYVLFNKLRNAIKDGFKNLVQYSDEVNHSVSTLNSSLSQFKNATAAAFAPILNTIAPILNSLIQLFIRATNAINQFFAALTGQSTWIRAKYVYDDVAESISSVGKAAEDAMKGVRAFDELNVINLPDTSGGGGGGQKMEDMFETVPIEDNFNKLAEKVKDIMSKLFQPLKEAWNKEGEFVMKSWKTALNNIKDMFSDIGRDFLKVWQQAETVKIFEDILHIIGDIGLVVGNLAQKFREAWNENSVGLHILENIRDVIGIIVGHIRNAADATVDWSANLDFYPLLDAFNNFVNSLKPAVDALSGVLEDFYTLVLLPLGKWTLEKGIPELLDVFTAFNDKVDWEALRQNLAEFWKHLEPFAETVGEGLIIFIERVSDLVADFLNSETFVNFLHNLEDWMDSVTPEDVADGIEKLAKAFLAFKVGGAVAKSIIFLTDNLTALKAIGSFTIAVTVAIAGFKVGKGLGKLLNPEDSEWYDSFKWLGEGGFFDQILPDTSSFETFKQDLGFLFDGIVQMATDFKNNPVIAGLVNILNPFAGASVKAQNDADKLVKTFETFKKTNEEIGDSFKSLKENFENTNEEIGNQFGFLKDNFQNTNEKIKEQIATLGEKSLETFGKIKEDISQAWDNVKAKTSEIWENVKTSLSENWENLKTDASTKFEDIKASISEKWSNLKADTLEKWSNIKTDLLDTWSDLKEKSSDKFDEIKTSISDAWQNLKKNTSETWNEIKDAIKTPINSIIGFINGMVSGVVKGINALGNALNNLSFEIPEWFSNVPGASGLAGKKFGFNIPQISAPNIPYLATGAVLRGGNPFLAVVNDQPFGQTNIEAPLDTIKQALREEMYAQDNNGGFFGLSEQQIYNIAYNAFSSAIANSQLIREQNEILGDIRNKPTISNGDITRSAISGINEKTKRNGKTPLLLY